MFKKLIASIIIAFTMSNASSTNIIIPYNPGGGVSQLFYLLRDYGIKKNVTLIPEFKPGAEASIGVTHASKLQPDGETLLLTVTSDLAHHLITPHTRSNIVPIMHVASATLAIVTGIDSKITSYEQLVRHLKSGKSLTWASPSPYLTKVSNEFQTAICGNRCDIEPIPFNGSNLALVNVAGGHIEVGLFPKFATAGLESSNKLRVLATSESLEDDCTLPKFGHLLKSVNDGYTLFAPKGISQESIEYWRTFIRDFQNDPEVRAKMVKAGLSTHVLEPQPGPDIQHQNQHKLPYCSWSVNSKGYIVSSEQPLTPRQTEVLDLITHRGLSNKQIARQLGIGESAVKLHVGALLHKFGARNRTELALRHTEVQPRLSPDTFKV